MTFGDLEANILKNALIDRQNVDITSTAPAWFSTTGQNLFTLTSDVKFSNTPADNTADASWNSLTNLTALKNGDNKFNAGALMSIVNGSLIQLTDAPTGTTPVIYIDGGLNLSSGVGAYTIKSNSLFFLSADVDFNPALTGVSNQFKPAWSPGLSSASLTNLQSNQTKFFEGDLMIVDGNNDLVKLASAPSVGIIGKDASDLTIPPAGGAVWARNTAMLL